MRVRPIRVYPDLGQDVLEVHDDWREETGACTAMESTRAIYTRALNRRAAFIVRTLAIAKAASRLAVRHRRIVYPTVDQLPSVPGDQVTHAVMLGDDDIEWSVIRVAPE